MAPSTRNPTHGQKVDLGENAPETAEGPGKIAKGSLAAESQAFKEANDLSSEQISQQKEHFGAGKHAHHESSTAYHGEGVGASERLAQPEKKHEKHNSPPKHDTAVTLKEESQESSSGKRSKGQDSSSSKDFSSAAKGGLGGDDDKTYSEATSGNKHSHAGQAPTYVNNVLGTERDPDEGPHGKNIKMDKSISGQNASFNEFDNDKDPGRLAEDNFAMAGNQGSVGESTSVRQKGIDGKTAFDALGSNEQA